MSRLKDLAVKVGSYVDNQGNQKNRYQNIGVLMSGNDGGQYILLDPLINLAAVPREAGKDRIMVSMFDPREPGAAPGTTAPRAQPRVQMPQEDVPF